MITEIQKYSFADTRGHTALIAKARWMLLLLLAGYSLFAAVFYSQSSIGLLLTPTQLGLLLTGGVFIGYTIAYQVFYEKLFRLKYINHFQIALDLFFVTEMDQHAERRLVLENSMRKALDNEEFYLLYQPKVDLNETDAAIAMGKSLNLKVIAEGVETEGQRDFLKQEECHEMQGFLFSKPVSADEVVKLLGNKPSSVKTDS